MRIDGRINVMGPFCICSDMQKCIKPILYDPGRLTRDPNVEVFSIMLLFPIPYLFLAILIIILITCRN